MATTLTSEAREELRARVRAALEARGQTQKAFEAEHGLPAGTLTRVFGGRRALDEQVERALAELEPAEPEPPVPPRHDDSGAAGTRRPRRMLDLPLRVLRLVASLVFRD